MHQQPTPHRGRRALITTLTLGLAGCAGRGLFQSGDSAQAVAESRAAGLALALPMPDPASYDTRYLAWNDVSRQRPVEAKLYLPASLRGAPEKLVLPLVVFSHGLGGSREGYTYMGKFWAAKGFASLHLQHVGSDRNVWTGNPLNLFSRMQAAAQESEAIDRVLDLRFALDQLLASELGPHIDRQRIAAAGHSYGANTTLLSVGAKVSRMVDGSLQALDFSDSRIRAAVVISAPPFYGDTDLGKILSTVSVPTLHITSTGDEINVPGYHSPPQDRLALYEATGGKFKTLAVFKEGSHSMFTDRLNTGGVALNPKVKEATRELTWAFFQRVFEQKSQPLVSWRQHYQPLVAQYEVRD